jgi:hypothetical protein
MERLLFDAHTVQNFSFQESELGSVVSGAIVDADSGGGGGGGGGVWGVVLPVFTRRGSYAMVVERTMD